MIRDPRWEHVTGGVAIFPGHPHPLYKIEVRVDGNVVGHAACLADVHPAHHRAVLDKVVKRIDAALAAAAVKKP